MSGCLDQVHCNCFMDMEGKRNAVASCVASVLFFGGWWIMIDTAAIYKSEDWSNVYIIVTVCASIAMFMVNAVSNSQVRGEAMQEGLLGTKGSRLWLMIGFVLAFASVIAAGWILLADYVFVPQGHAIWPGVALFIHVFLIFLSALVYKFGRTEELWG